MAFPLPRTVRTFSEPDTLTFEAKPTWTIFATSSSQGATREGSLISQTWWLSDEILALIFGKIEQTHAQCGNAQKQRLRLNLGNDME